ncbi:MAG: TetR/AcrR family transcriptional regulator [Sphingomonadaceae bacterium]|nr:TetR/AcrR family transcriptional regulator [Sphingomonadaceae bacterium]
MEVAIASPAAKGRPREFCTEQALASALRVFWKRGYEGASMAELTAEMGITKPSLYAAYGNKEALFKKALDLYEREKLAYVGEALEAPTARGVAERLLRGALAMQSSSCDPKGCLNVIGAVACGVEAESIREEVLKRRASSQAVLIARFERAQADGDLPDGIAPTALVSYLLAVMQGLSVQASANASRENLEAIVETALATWPGR